MNKPKNDESLGAFLKANAPDAPPAGKGLEDRVMSAIADPAVGSRLAASGSRQPASASASASAPASASASAPASASRPGLAWRLSAAAASLAVAAGLAGVLVMHQPVEATDDVALDEFMSDNWQAVVGESTETDAMPAYAVLADYD